VPHEVGVEVDPLLLVTTLLGVYVLAREDAVGKAYNIVLSVILVLVSSVIALMLYTAVDVHMRSGRRSP